MSIEKRVKKQYSKIPLKKDWELYKEGAEYYFKNAACIKKVDIKHCAEAKKLLFRNINKRLFLGIGSELLMRSIYLKEGYYINNKKNKIKGQDIIVERKSCSANEMDTNSLLRFDDLITHANRILRSIPTEVLEGLKIAKSFRNKEAHSIFMWHKMDKENYRTIESAITFLYNEFFGEDLNFKIAFLDGEKPMFIIKKR